MISNYPILLGSKMLRMNNYRDEDWLTFVDIPPEEKKNGEISIPFLLNLIHSFVEGKNVPGDASKALYLYQISEGFHTSDDYPISFNILEHKNVWIQCLKSYMNSERTEKSIENRDILLKKFYHILYQYHMIIEDTHWISDEARVNVQKIHDLEMPSSYFYELRELINSL